MKKFSLYCLITFTAVLCSILPAQREVSAANSTVKESGSTETGILTGIRLPVRAPSSVLLSYVNLAEQEKWILDEILSDYVSEHVVQLTEDGMDYALGDWIDREAYTCLFLEKILPEGTLYMVCGYAGTGSGYVYFELSSSQPLTIQQVDREVKSSFSRNQGFQRGIC